MTYGSEVVIPLEFGFPTLRTDQFNIEENHHLLLDSLDLAEERREVVMINMAYTNRNLSKGMIRGESQTIGPRKLGLEKGGGDGQEPCLGQAGS